MHIDRMQQSVEWAKSHPAENTIGIQYFSNRADYYDSAHPWIREKVTEEVKRCFGGITIMNAELNPNLYPNFGFCLADYWGIEYGAVHFVTSAGNINLAIMRMNYLVEQLIAAENINKQNGGL